MKRDFKKPKKKNPKVAKPLGAEAKKKFYKHLGYLAICILGLFFLMDAKPPLSYLALAFFLVAAFQLRILIINANQIIDALVPPKNHHEKKTKRFDEFIFYFANAFFGTSLIALLFEIRQFGNTLNASSFFWKSGGKGLLMAFVITIILLKFKPSVYDNSKRRFTVHAGLFLGFFLMVPTVASYINHAYADDEVMCRNVSVIKKEDIKRRKRKTKDYYVHLKIGPIDSDRFEIKKSFYDIIEEGDSVNFCTKKGKLGYEYVIEINPNQSW